MNTRELFADGAHDSVGLGAGITLLRGFADSRRLVPLIENAAVTAPFRHLVTPGGQTHVGGHDQLRPRRLGQRPRRISLRDRAIP